MTEDCLLRNLAKNIKIEILNCLIRNKRYKSWAPNPCKCHKMGLSCSKSKDSKKKKLEEVDNSFKSMNLLREERKLAEVNELLHRAEDVAEKAGSILMVDDDVPKNVNKMKRKK